MSSFVFVISLVFSLINKCVLHGLRQICRRSVYDPYAYYLWLSVFTLLKPIYPNLMSQVAFLMLWLCTYAKYQSHFLNLFSFPITNTKAFSNKLVALRLVQCLLKVNYANFKDSIRQIKYLYLNVRKLSRKSVLCLRILIHFLILCFNTYVTQSMKCFYTLDQLPFVLYSPNTCCSFAFR